MPTRRGLTKWCSKRFAVLDQEPPPSASMPAALAGQRTMSPRAIGLSDSLCRYLIETGVREPDALRAVRESTSRLPGARMQIGPEQGHLMGLLAGLTKSSSCLEIGTHTGYSALSIALALPPYGRVLTCEIDADHGAIAQQNWESAGVAHKIEQRLGRRWTRSMPCW
jgi:caffeoyl-CoA O-methyltransferase